MRYSLSRSEWASKSTEHTRRIRSTLMGRALKSPWRGRLEMATAANSKKPKAMPKKSLQHFEKRLLEERKRVLKELGHYDEAFGTSTQEADGDLSSYSFHMADQARTPWSA